MSIGIEPDAAQLAAAPTSPLESESFVQELARLANQMFQNGGPVQGPPVSNITPPVAPPTGGPLPGVVAPPNPGPSAFGVGGASTAQSSPPTPGFLTSPPIANAPPPKEGDLRSIGALLADPLHTQPVRLAQGPATAPTSVDSAPYFLALAGMPSANSLPPQGNLPGSSVSGSQLPGGSVSPGAATASPPMPPGGAPAGLAPPSIVSSPDSPLGAPLPSSSIPGSTDFEPQLFAYHQVQEVPKPRQSSSLFDPYAVKRDFPILRERVHGRELVWLDNAATTQKPRSVIERLSYYYEHENSNIHRAAHALAGRATDAYEGAREKVRRFVNAPSVKDIIFVRGATEGINLIAQSWGRRNIGPGDEIVITWLEHHANIVPWQQLASEKGAKLRVVPVDSRGQVILEEYEKLLGPRTKLVSITQVSNALGSIVPVKEMTEIAHRYGACVIVDGAQAVSHIRADVQALDCEFYVFSGHKVFAPTGIGAVYGKTQVLEHMPPWQGGGNMIADVTFEKTLYQAAPNRFEAGTGNIADAVGLGAALDYVTSLGIENIARYEHELLEYGTDRLHEVPGLTIIGTAADKAGVLSFVLDGQKTEEISGVLDQEGIAVRSGHHCAQPILRRFGLEATVRASLAPYNTREDIDALVAALKRIQVGRPRH
ncbi:MAG: SufS family cysteine desulfurase [Myxococcales bacterium]|nr:MAG: SufS family cysteine desulfurase [Myxococcales bacterium]